MSERASAPRTNEGQTPRDFSLPTGVRKQETSARHGNQPALFRQRHDWACTRESARPDDMRQASSGPMEESRSAAARVHHHSCWLRVSPRAQQIDRIRAPRDGARWCEGSGGGGGGGCGGSRWRDKALTGCQGNGGIGRARPLLTKTRHRLITWPLRDALAGIGQLARTRCSRLPPMAS